ncbi:hypothetical protein CDCA_CDCA15G4023 [Cyanidium caldarium]|uniref:Helicase-associated domain-containing protein n=1 Tax=Cyanidium caldarium TaxID=2771 RepID=A0AAV9J0Y0_CYACA|nr:hypothetical protein CDCA_CDCA15G4023 [Cyanidium caldarium]
MIHLNPDQANAFNFRQLMQARQRPAPSELSSAAATATPQASERELPQASKAVLYDAVGTDEGTPVAGSEVAGADTSQPTDRHARAVGAASTTFPKTAAGRLPPTLRAKRKAPSRANRRGRKRLVIRGNYDSDDSVYDYDSDFIDDTDIVVEGDGEPVPRLGMGLMGAAQTRLQRVDGGRVNDDEDDDEDDFDLSSVAVSRPAMPEPVERPLTQLEARIRDQYGERKPDQWSKDEAVLQLLDAVCDAAVVAGEALEPTMAEPMLYTLSDALVVRLGFLRTTRPRLLREVSARYWRRREAEYSEQLQRLHEPLETLFAAMPGAEHDTDASSYWTEERVQHLHAMFVAHRHVATAANFRYKKPRGSMKVVHRFAAELKQHPAFRSVEWLTARDLESTYRRHEHEMVERRKQERQAERQRKRQDKQQRANVDETPSTAATTMLEAVNAEPSPPQPQVLPLAPETPGTPARASQGTAPTDAVPNQADAATAPLTPSAVANTNIGVAGGASTATTTGNGDGGGGGGGGSGGNSGAKRKYHSLDERFEQLRQWRYECTEWSTNHPYPSVISQKDAFRSVRLWVKSQRMAAKGTGHGRLAPRGFFDRCKQELEVDLLHRIDVPWFDMPARITGQARRGDPAAKRETALPPMKMPATTMDASGGEAPSDPPMQCSAPTQSNPAEPPTPTPVVVHASRAEPEAQVSEEAPTTLPAPAPPDPATPAPPAPLPPARYTIPLDLAEEAAREAERAAAEFLSPPQETQRHHPA